MSAPNAKLICLLALLQMSLIAQTKSSSSQFPPYMGENFDYASFTRFDPPENPPSSYLALSAIQPSCFWDRVSELAHRLSAGVPVEHIGYSTDSPELTTIRADHTPSVRIQILHVSSQRV